MTTLKENILEAENSALRELVAQAGLDASRLLEQAGIKATERDAAERLQRLLLEELHHRVKNTLATVMAIASQSLRNATDLESDSKVQEGLQSFRSMSRIEAKWRNATAVRFRFSQSLASLRQRFNQAIDLSTIQRFGRITKPFARSDRFTISMCRLGKIAPIAVAKIVP